MLIQNQETGEWYDNGISMWDDESLYGEKQETTTPEGNPMMYGSPRTKMMGEIASFPGPTMRDAKQKVKEETEARTGKVSKGGFFYLAYPLEAKKPGGEPDLERSQKLENYEKRFGPSFTQTIQDEAQRLGFESMQHRSFGIGAFDPWAKAITTAEQITKKQEREKEQEEIAQLIKENRQSQPYS